jgi:hypothetical protein
MGRDAREGYRRGGEEGKEEEESDLLSRLTFETIQSPMLQASVNP